MKKLFVLSVFVLFGLMSTTTFAQEAVIESAVEVETAQDETEVKVSELPEAVAKTLKENFAGFTAEKASKVSKKGETLYLVTLTKGEKNLVALVDSNGKIIDRPSDSK